MKIKKYHGNVTILTLFVLLASALMGVLVALYMKNFIRYSDEITSYEKTNYLAKAGAELGLAIVGSREVGLVYSIDSGDSIKLNFECPFPVDEGEECPVDPKFSLQIDGIGNSYENCSPSNQITIKTGFSAIIPLFRDSGVVGGIADALTGQSITNRTHDNKIERDGDLTNGRRFAIVRSVKDERLNNTLEWSEPWGGNLDNIWDSKKRNDTINHGYLIAANTSKTNNKTICVKGNNIPQETVKIISIGYYNNRQLGTETLATKALPSFLQGDNYIYNIPE